MSNKSDGNAFEREFCETLAKYKFWVHNMAQNSAGQPADVIAVREGTPYLIDCKVCKNNSFPLSRIEPNQHHAMKLWKECHNGSGWFALDMAGEVYMISHSMLLMVKTPSLSKTDVETIGIKLEKWAELI